MSDRVHIDVTPSEQVTVIAYPGEGGKHTGVRLILAHGAGAGQASSFMVRLASALAARGVDTVTFNFLYTEQGRRVPDRNDKLEACYRKVIESCRDGVLDGKPRAKLVIGGKSMGGRIASQVAAADGSGIAGLVLLGYPLHPPGQSEKLRTKHLPCITAPISGVTRCLRHARRVASSYRAARGSRRSLS
jgi:predicted alpha/beta-hydrolase family hydrolase